MSRTNRASAEGGEQPERNRQRPLPDALASAAPVPESGGLSLTHWFEQLDGGALPETPAAANAAANAPHSRPGTSLAGDATELEAMVRALDSPSRSRPRTPRQHLARDAPSPALFRPVAGRLASL